MGGKGGGGGGGTQTVQQNADPWSGQQPYLNNLFSRAENLYNQGTMAPPYYSGQTVADQDPWTLQALEMQAARAMSGSDAMRSAQDQLAKTMSGYYLDQNPHLDAMVKRATDQSINAINGNFAQAGRYGSGVHAAAAGDQAANIATQMYGQAWDKERENQIKAMMFAPSLASADYQDIAALSEAGIARENHAQELINDAMNKYNYEAGRPLTALQNYGALIQGNYGMSGTSTTSGSLGRSNPLGGAMGGALAGGALGSMFGTTQAGTALGPWGAVGGGLLGLFGSMF
jgi:hypothetical protein